MSVQWKLVGAHHPYKLGVEVETYECLGVQAQRVLCMNEESRVLFVGTRAEVRAYLAGLRDGIERLGADPVLRETHGRAGARALEERFTESVVMEKYFDLIVRAAEERDPALGGRLAAACGRKREDA